MQEKLLRVIEYGQYERVGGNQVLNANVRLVCATNANLPQMAQQGTFRADLLDRLAFDVIHLPALRHRPEDIALLAEHFAIRMCRELQLPLFVGFSPNALHQLQAYSWPGNVRELKNVVERAVYQHGLNSQPIDQLVFNPFQSSDIVTDESEQVDVRHTTRTDFHLPLDYKAWQQQCDIELLQAALTQAKFNQKHAAQLLGLSYHQFRGMMRKYPQMNSETPRLTLSDMR